MVPEPTTATLFTGSTGVSFGMSGIFATSRSPKKTWMSAFDWSEKRHSVNNFRLGLAALFERHSGRRFYRIDRRERSLHPPLFLTGGIPSCGQNCGILRHSSQLFRSFARLGDGLVGDSARESHRPGEQIPVDQTIDQSKRGSLVGGNRLALGTHLHCFRDADKPRQTLRSRGAGNNSELHFRLAHLRRG